MRGKYFNKIINNEKIYMHKKIIYIKEIRSSWVSSLCAWARGNKLKCLGNTHGTQILKKKY
jgi:hypothetical protein